MTETEEKNFKKIAKGIAMQFGKNCEVVLHDYSKPYDSTIIAIENGHVSGRKVGDCGTNLGLEILRGVTENNDQYNYVTQVKNGRIFRSSSIYLRDENDAAIGALCINFDITDLIVSKNLLEDLTFQNDALSKSEYKPQEFITNDINTLLDSMIEKSVQVAGVPVQKMTKEDKVQALRYLDNHGAFLIKKAGEKIAKYFDISKFTLYNYLEESRVETGSNQESAQ